MDSVEQLVAALDLFLKERNGNGGGMRYKAPANYNTAALLTQPGGMFAVAGVETDVISLHVTPRGVGSMLPSFPSNLDDPRFAFLTGFSDDIGNNPTNPCDDAPTGYMKSGMISARFGRVPKGTETIEIDRLLHEKRGVNTNLRLLNSMLFGDVGHSMNMTPEGILNLVVKAEMVNAGVRMERTLSTMVWQGAIGNDTAGGGYKEFPGLDSQIATGIIDAETGGAIPSADSDVKEFNYNLVDGTALDIVEYMSMMEYYLRHKAERTNMLPITWVVAMRPELWFELSAVWPCRYLTHRCQTDAGANPMVINDNVNVAMRDAMRNGMYIDINGNRYPVVTDDGIFEHTNANNANVPAGNFASSIYFVPVRVRGNFPATYWEYIDYTQINAQLAPMGAGMRNTTFWTDGGRYLWVYKDNGWCFNLQVKTEPRIVLRTPHLAGKIQHVMYTPLQHLASPYPSSPYHVDGGVSLRGTSTTQAVWGTFNT